MSKEKQIDEMAKHCHFCKKGKCLLLEDEAVDCDKECDMYEFAKRLYNAGYRKQSEGEWEIVKGSNGKEIMVCTNCRHSQDLHSTFTYCPNCGARMHGAKMKGGAE